MYSMCVLYVSETCIFICVYIIFLLSFHILIPTHCHVYKYIGLLNTISGSFHTIFTDTDITYTTQVYTTSTLLHNQINTQSTHDMYINVYNV